MGKKNKIEEPIIQSPVIERPQDYTPDPFQVKKDLYKRDKDSFFSDERLYRQDSVTQRNTLGKFFDNISTPFYREAGVADDAVLKELKEKFINDNIGKLSLAKKKEEEKEPVVPVEYPDFFDKSKIYEKTYARQDAIKPIMTDVDVTKLDQAHKAQRESDERISSFVPKMLETPEFGYIKSRPEDFLELTKLEESNISKYLKSQGLNTEEREVAWAILNNTATQSFLKKTRKNYTPEQLNKESLQYAQPYLDNAETGTFMDPKTGMRKKQAETEEDADQLALLHKYQEEILKSVLLSSTTHPLSKEKDKLDEDQEALSAEYEKLEELRKIAAKSMKLRSETWMDDMEAWKRSQLDFIKKEKDLEKKINDFNNKIKEDKSAIGSITKDVTDKEKLQQAVNDAYLLKKYWDDRFARADKNWSDEKNWVPGGSIQMRTFGMRPEFQATMDRINEKRAEATAYFEAASRMLYNNEGPLDIKKDLGFYTEMLGDAMVKTILKKNYPKTAPQTEFATLQKIGEVGMREGITFTKEEEERLKVGFLEHATLIAGTLLPDIPSLILIGGVTNIIKSGKFISNLRYGSKVIQNIASKGTRTLAFDDAVPTGWKVISELKPTAIGKIKGAIYSAIIDEAAFTGALGMAPGMVSGMNTAHLFLPDLVLKGKVGAVIQPFLDMAYKGAIGSTVGMEMGAATAGMVNALFTGKTFSDVIDELYPNLEDVSKRVLAELAVNGIFFGGMGALTKAGQKAATAPLGGKYGKNGGSSWTAYFNPVFRKRVFDAAKEADAKGYTDTARELYRWLDSTKEPITGDDIKQARMQETEEIAKVMPVGVVRSSAEANRQAIYKLEELKEDPNFDGYVTIKTRTSKDIKNGDTVEMDGKYYEVTDVTRDKKGNPTEFTLMDVETGEPTKALTEDVRTDFYYKVGSRLELSLRLENHYEKLQVLNEVLAERGFYGKDFKALPAGPETPKQLGKATGIDYVKPPEPKKINKILKTIEKRQTEMEEETGEKIVLPEELRPIEKFGIPEKIIETPAGEFSSNLNKVRTRITKEVERINGEIVKIDEKLALPEFRGRVEAGKRAEKIQLTSERDKLQNQLEAIKLKGNKEFTEFWKTVSPIFSDYIKSQGDFSEDEVQEIIEDAWGRFSQPSESLKEITIGQIFDKSIKDYIRPSEQKGVFEKPWDVDKLLDKLNLFNSLTLNAKTNTTHGAMLANQIKLAAEKLGIKWKQDGDRNITLTTVTGGQVRRTSKMPTKEEIEDQKLLAEYPEDFQQTVRDIIEYSGEGFKYILLEGLSVEQRAQAQRDILAGKKSKASKTALKVLEEMIKDGYLFSYDAGRGAKLPIPIEELKKEIESLRKEERAKELEKLLPYQVDEAYEKGLLTKEERDGINEIIRSANIEPEAEPTGEEDITTAPTGPIQREEKTPEQKPTDFGIEPNGGINPYLFKVDQYYSDYNNGLKVTVANRKDEGKSIARMRELNDILRNETLGNTIDYIQSMLDIYDKGLELMPGVKAERELEYQKNYKAKMEEMRNALDVRDVFDKWAEAMDLLQGNMRKAFKELDFESNGIHAIKQAINKTADEIQKQYGSVKNIKDVKDIGEKPAIEGKPYKYRLTLRPFDIGTQPKEGFIKAELEPGERYETLTYDRKLTTKEREHFDLRPLTEVEEIEGKEFVDKDDNYSRISLKWHPSKGGAEVSMYDMDGELVEKPFFMNTSDILKNLETGYWKEKPTITITPEKVEPKVTTPKEPPKPKPPVDIEKDLRDMTDLLNLLGPDESGFGMEAGGPPDDIKVKLGQMAKGMVEKFTKAGITDFNEILTSIIPQVNVPALKKLFPFLKEGYGAYYQTAPEEIADKMESNLKSVRQFKESDLDALISKVKNIEPVEPQTEEQKPVINKGKKKELDSFAREFDDIGDIEHAEWIRNLKDNEEVTDEILDNIRALAQERLLESQIRAGAIWFDNTPFTPTNETMLFAKIEKMHNKGVPLEPFIRDILSEEQIGQAIKCENQLNAWLSTAGLTQEKIANFPFLRLKFEDISVARDLFIIGETAENGYASIADLNSKIKAFDNALIRSAAKIVNLRKFLFTWRIKYMLNNGIEIKDAAHLRKIASETFRFSSNANTDIREQAETALVELATVIARNRNMDSLDRFNRILSLYETFPRLQVFFTNEVKEKQQFSTPVPLAYVMGRYTNGLEVDSMLDPSAGNGALAIAVEKRAVNVNEIDMNRYQNLADQGYRTYSHDARESLKGKLDRDFFDVIHTNPPFGLEGVAVFNGEWKLGGTSLMVARALEMMADHGKAAIIIGGHTKYNDKGQVVDSGTPESQLRLFNYLYKYYNVEDVINIPGNFYSQMGTSYPVRLILINGRKAAPIGVAPLQSARGALENPIASWNELYERIDKLTTPPNEKAILRRQMDANREPGSLIRSRNSPVPKNQEDIGPVTPPSEPLPEPLGERPGKGETTPTGTVPKPAPGVEPVKPSGPDNELPPDAQPDRGPEGPTVRKPKDSGKTQFIPSIGDIPKYKPGIPVGRAKRTLGLADRETDQTIPYVPLSRVPGGNTLIPATMANELEDALLQLREEIGDIDTYVMSRLKYNSIEDLSNAFYAEQVDALAMVIFNIENGGSAIIGDQTGVGKGRVAAGIIAYTIERGNIPVFITKSANLFTDIYRDLIAIGKGQYIPFIMNKEYQGEVTKIFKPNTDEILYQWDPNHYKNMMENRLMSKNAQFILATYSQFNTDKGNSLKRRDFLLEHAWNSVFIMDESHEASGASNTGKFFQEFILKAKGGMFLSATFAKRPDNLPVYAMKTVLQEANLSQEQLVEAIVAGGPALQEIISSQLTESIQFTRRQLNMEGIERNWYILGDEDKNSFFYNPELGKQLRKDYDGVTTIIHKIINFQRDHVKPVIQAMDEEVIKEGERMGIKRGTMDLGVNNASYFSKVFNIVNQLLLAIKVPHVIPMILEELSAGRKPFITLSSTMESMLDDLDLEFDQEIEPDFRYVLKRGLDGVLRYTRKTASGIAEHGKLEVENLSPTGQTAYWELNDLIKNISTGITISPIDVLIKGITDAGYKVAEITGRHMKFELSSDFKKGKYVTNQRPNKNTLINAFNNEPGCAIIANVSGSTGLSAHSSPLFRDTSQRVGFNLQTDLDVNIVVQKEGRINRSDQLNKPMYINIISILPAEKRLAMMNARKLKSLYANTSSNQKSSKTITDTIDFLNKYGDEVVGEWLKDNPDINKELGEPLDLSKDPIDVQNAAYKVTGKVAVLSTDIQERFYNEVLERYEALIEYLDSTGGNDLAVNSLPLNATILNSEVVIQGKGGISVFGDDSVLETIEVDILKKMIPQKDLMDLIEKELSPKSPGYVYKREVAYQDGIIEQMRRSMEDTLAKKITNLQQSYDDRIAAKRKIAQDRKGTAEENETWLNNEILEMEEKHIILIGMYERAKDSNVNFYEKLMRFFYPGRVLDVPFTATDQLELVRMNKGVFLGFDINMNKQNPFAPSSVMLRFATADSRRSFRVPASKSEYITSIMGHSAGIGPQEQEDTLRDWDKLKPARDREKRFVVTGNILQAMPNYKGRLIEFTMQDGTVRKGILMPENWIKDDDGKIIVPASKMYNIIRALAPMDYVESVSRNVQIQKDRPSYEGTIDNFFLKVPASRTRGEKFWSDEQLKSFIENNRFEGKGDWMVGRFRPNDIIPILQHLQTKFGESFQVRADNVQHYEVSQGSAINMLSEMERVTKEVSGHGQTRPEAEVLGAKGANMKQRIGAEPITGKKPKKIWEIEKDFADALGQKIFWDKTARKGMAASYTAALGKVVIDKFFITNLNIAAHELGHRLDDMFGLVGPEAQSRLTQFDSELKELWQFGSKPPKGAKDPHQYQRMEGVAEYFRAFVVNPKETVKRYPIFSKWFEERIRAKGNRVWDAIAQFSEDVRVFYGARAVDKIQSNMKMGKQANEKLPWGWTTLFKPTSKQGDFAITMFDLGAIKMLNSTRAAEKAYLWALAQSGKTINPNDQFIIDKDGNKSINPKYVDPRENFIVLSRLLNGNMDKIGNMMMKGVTDSKLRRQYDPKTGSPISFVWKYEALPDASIPEMEKFRTEALAFMVGERVIEAIEKFVQKQLRMDLEAFEDMIPPLDILKKYPHVYEKYLPKIQRILDRWVKEDLDDDKVFLPKERYNFDRMQIIGVNQEGFTDKMVAEQSVAEFAQLKKDNPERAAMMEEYARRHRMISMAYIRYAYEKGLMSSELYEMIVQEDLHYVSLHRYFQETGPTTEGSSVKGFDDLYTIGRDSKGLEGKLHIHPLKGSARPMVDADLIQMEASYSIVLNADKTEALRFFALAFTGGRTSYEGEPVQFADIGYMVKGPGPHVLKFFIAGEPLYFKVQNPYVYKPLKGLLESPQLPGWATLLPRILRNSITLSPPFAIKNKLRDMNQTMMIAQTKYKPSDWKEPKGLKGAKMSDMYDLAGGGQFGFYIRNKTEYYRLQKEWMFKHSNDPKKFFLEFSAFVNTNWDAFTGFMSKSEKSTRIAFAKAEFNRLVKGGMDPYDALLQSAFSTRDLLDFHVAGEWMKVINQFIPFANAAIRGLDKVIRTARDRPGNLIGSWFLLALMPAIANSMMIATMDDDTIDEYKQLPPYQRDMFFNIPLGSGRWLTIPKPFELGYMSSAVQRIADKYLLNDEAGLNEDWFRLGYNMLFPFDFSGITGGFAGIIHGITKRDYFRDTWVIPPNEMDVAIVTRNTESATKLGQAIQEGSRILSKKKEPIVDARIVDDFIEAQVPYYGTYLLKASELITGGASQRAMRFDWNDLGLVKSSPMYNAEDVQWVLKTAKKYKLNGVPEMDLLNTVIRLYFSEEIQSDREKMLKVGRDARVIATQIRKKWDRPEVNFAKMYEEYKATR